MVCPVHKCITVGGFRARAVAGTLLWSSINTWVDAALSAPFPREATSAAKGDAVGLGQPQTRDARGIVGAKTLALMNTPAEPVPTEDTLAVTQEQASLQEQLLARTLTVVLGHCPL